MNGYVGPPLSKNKKLGDNMSGEYALSLRKECAGPAVGLVVLIVETI